MQDTFQTAALLRVIIANTSKFATSLKLEKSKQVGIIEISWSILSCMAISVFFFFFVMTFLLLFSVFMVLIVGYYSVMLMCIRSQGVGLTPDS